MPRQPIVSIGLPRRLDLERLGSTFSFRIPPPNDELFADLMSRLDEIEIETLGPAVTFGPKLDC